MNNSLETTHALSFANWHQAKTTNITALLLDQGWERSGLAQVVGIQNFDQMAES